MHGQQDLPGRNAGEPQMVVQVAPAREASAGRGGRVALERLSHQRQRPIEARIGLRQSLQRVVAVRAPLAVQPGQRHAEIASGGGVLGVETLQQHVVEREGRGGVFGVLGGGWFHGAVTGGTLRRHRCWRFMA